MNKLYEIKLHDKITNEQMFEILDEMKQTIISKQPSRGECAIRYMKKYGTTKGFNNDYYEKEIEKFWSSQYKE